MVGCDTRAVPDVTVDLLQGTTPEAVEALNALLPQVSSRARSLSAAQVAVVVANESTRVLVARLDGEIVGMALLLVLTTFTGRSGYVEEVAVDESSRGHGVSTQLMRALLRLAADLDLMFVDLTSRSSREAANHLYRSVGFTLRETNCYRHDLKGYRE